MRPLREAEYLLFLFLGFVAGKGDKLLIVLLLSLAAGHLEKELGKLSIGTDWTDYGRDWAPPDGRRMGSR